MSAPMTTHSTQRGAAMMEVLITMMIIAFGLLGFVGLQGQTTLAQIEAYQRTQALILLNDMAARMVLNRTNIAAYAANNIGITDPGACGTAATLATKDICEWSLLIQGSSEVKDGAKLGAVTGARGCIVAISATQYVVSLVWQGVQPSGAPATTCGANAYAAENTRRAVTTVVNIATLGT
ncbi:MAG: type IV pilus modification protein PilV [Bdellovibrionales bacterium]|nr:type IV pilus modification protein PilV [Ramlibacter sp.]